VIAEDELRCSLRNEAAVPPQLFGGVAPAVVLVAVLYGAGATDAHRAPPESGSPTASS
jgi:hypothetical protein